MSNDYDTLVSIVRNQRRIKNFSEKLEQWSDSPFSAILSLPSRTIGALGEELVSEILVKKGCYVQRARNSSYDRLINKYKCEIKFSTLWKDGMYAFQQVRNTNWDYLLCLGISPNTAHFWYAEPNIVDVLPGQHKGKEAVDTKWMHIIPSENNPYPDYLFGGELSYGIRLFLQKITEEQT